MIVSISCVKRFYVIIKNKPNKTEMFTFYTGKHEKLKEIYFVFTPKWKGSYAYAVSSP